MPTVSMEIDDESETYDPPFTMTSSYPYMFPKFMILSYSDSFDKGINGVEVNSQSCPSIAVGDVGLFSIKTREVTYSLSLEDNEAVYHSFSVGI